MSGKRAKQRRRLILLAAAGDPQAQVWCTLNLTFTRRGRLFDRIVAAQSRRAAPREAPPRWNPQEAEARRAYERRARRK
jgi:hypothetical protein